MTSPAEPVPGRWEDPTSCILAPRCHHLPVCSYSCWRWRQQTELREGSPTGSMLSKWKGIWGRQWEASIQVPRKSNQVSYLLLAKSTKTLEDGRVEKAPLKYQETKTGRKARWLQIPPTHTRNKAPRFRQGLLWAASPLRGPHISQSRKKRRKLSVIILETSK